MKKTQQGGWTLVEVMIVVIIIGLLLAIAAPNLYRARSLSRAQAVCANLSQIFTAKEQFMYENSLAPGAMVNNGTDLAPKYIKEWPSGPVQGTYMANEIGSDPTFLGESLSWYEQHCIGSAADSACPL